MYTIHVLTLFKIILDNMPTPPPAPRGNRYAVKSDNHRKKKTMRISPADTALANAYGFPTIRAMLDSMARGEITMNTPFNFIYSDQIKEDEIFITEDSNQDKKDKEDKILRVHNIQLKKVYCCRQFIYPPKQADIPPPLELYAISPQAAAKIYHEQTRHNKIFVWEKDRENETKTFIELPRWKLTATISQQFNDNDLYFPIINTFFAAYLIYNKITVHPLLLQQIKDNLWQQLTYPDNKQLSLQTEYGLIAVFPNPDMNKNNIVFEVDPFSYVTVNTVPKSLASYLPSNRAIWLLT